MNQPTGIPSYGDCVLPGKNPKIAKSLLSELQLVCVCKLVDCFKTVAQISEILPGPGEWVFTFFCHCRFGIQMLCLYEFICYGLGHWMMTGTRFLFPSTTDWVSCTLGLGQCLRL